MTIQYDNLLARLRGVRKTHPRPGIERSHRALCPCHQSFGPVKGRSPSLSIAESSSGTILIHCHGGCAKQDITDSLGIDLSDLFPSLREGAPGAGNGGPANWMSVASLTHDVERAVARLYAFRTPDSLFELGGALDRLRVAAREAMRGGAK
jgi:hypothetical protein